MYVARQIDTLPAARVFMGYRAIVIAAPLALTLCAGCEPSGPTLYPVSGTVVWTDGSPAAELAGGLVELKSTDASISPQGQIAEDGSFTVSLQGKQGAPAGSYSAIVVPRMEITAMGPPKIIDLRFVKHETSGLQLTVDATDNLVELKVAKYRGQ